jgi:predicted phosphate transport protein (TIGR00153 family)
MNWDRLLKLFVPKDYSFFPLFEGSAQNLIKASELLKTLVVCEDMEHREEITKQIKAMENTGDDITQKIYDQLNKSFITPFDREDIHELASNIDDVIDFINGSARRINLYKPKTLSFTFKEMADVIFEAAKEIEFSVNHLRDAGRNKEKIIDSCVKLNILEKSGDDIYHQGITKLFEEEKDTTELIKKKEIIETLEKTVDKAEDVSDTIKTILIKMA